MPDGTGSCSASKKLVHSPEQHPTGAPHTISSSTDFTNGLWVLSCGCWKPLYGGYTDDGENDGASMIWSCEFKRPEGRRNEELCCSVVVFRTDEVGSEIEAIESVGEFKHPRVLDESGEDR